MTPRVPILLLPTKAIVNNLHGIDTKQGANDR